MASQITPLPTPPQRTDDQQTFTSRADAFLGALPAFATQANVVATEAEADANAASSAASTATTKAAEALASANAAAASAAAAGNSAGTQATSTSSLTIGTGSKSITLAQTGKAFVVNQFVIVTNSTNNWMAGNITAFNSGTGAMTVDVTSTAGSGTFASWTITPSSPVFVPSVPRSTRTANTILAGADRGVWIDITSGTFTQTFTAAATLGNGWYCWLSNSGTTDITIDPNASETIDGLTSFVMYPGELRFIQCNGTAFESYVINSFSKVFTTSGTFVKPPGYNYFEGELWGGGGSGGKSNVTSQFASGGGGGACLPFLLPYASVAASESVSIGAGGAAQSLAGQGQAGGNSTFGSLLTSYGGGAGGQNTSTNVTGGAGGGVLGAGTNGSTASSSQGGQPSDSNQTNNHGFGGGQGNVGAGGNSAYGGGGGGGSSSVGFVGGKSVYGGAGGGGSGDGAGSSNSGAGGTSVFGGGGGAGSRDSSGTDGVTPAGGGGATRAGAVSGAGARGEFRIRGVI